jgi:hypothetical protein
MRKLLLVAGLAAAALVPSFAFAQSCEQQHDSQVATTLAGAGIGALLGASIAGRHDQGAGAVIGAAGGAVVGSQVNRPDRDCTHAYGYYDHNNQWHATATDRADARGYYDRDGAWVDGAPNGYYDSGNRWVSANNAAADGYYDDRGRWSPASSDGYYDDRGQWVASASGHYENGRWIAGHGAGAYDRNGRWVAGALSGHTDANGVWVADAQPGYYDSDHHWRSGPVRGYYDTRGVWVGASLSADTYGANTSYRGAGYQGGGGHRDVDTRVAWLQQRIDTAAQDGSLNRFDARSDRRQLASIRRDETFMRQGDGQLSPRAEARLQNRLDALSASLRQSLNGAGF